MVMGPKFPNMIGRRPDDCEPFMPHVLWEERSHPSEAVSGGPTRRPEGLQLLFSRQGEEPSSLVLNLLYMTQRYPMVHQLKSTPRLACLPYELQRIGVREVDDWHWRRQRQLPERDIVVRGFRLPHMRVRHGLHGREVEGDDMFGVERVVSIGVREGTHVWDDEQIDLQRR